MRGARRRDLRGAHTSLGLAEVDSQWCLTDWEGGEMRARLRTLDRARLYAVGKNMVVTDRSRVHDGYSSTTRQIVYGSAALLTS